MKPPAFAAISVYASRTFLQLSTPTISGIDPCVTVSEIDAMPPVAILEWSHFIMMSKKGNPSMGASSQRLFCMYNCHESSPFSLHPTKVVFDVSGRTEDGFLLWPVQLTRLFEPQIAKPCTSCNRPLYIHVVVPVI